MHRLLNWLLRIIPSLIMLQTLYFKFTAHPQSVKLFTILGMEPWGRIGIGIAELIAAILLLLNSTVLIGALLGTALMCGAVFFHVTNTKIGINFDGDPLLFIYAVITLTCCVILTVSYRKKIPALLKLQF